MEIWSFEMMVLLSGLLPNPKLETSVLSIWLVVIIGLKIENTFYFVVLSFALVGFLHRKLYSTLFLAIDSD